MEHVFIQLGITLLTFLMMEGVTWCTHKYVMHGFLWYLHEDHHNTSKHVFEKNDVFFLVFAIPSFCCIFFGLKNNVFSAPPIGYGIAAYGFAYFLVHDIIIHQRFKLFRRSNNTYVKAIRWAHKMHHKHLTKYKGESFGLLFVHKKYWQKNLTNRKKEN